MFLVSKMQTMTPGFRPIYEYQGTSASEYLNASNIKSYWTHFNMGGGDDTVVTPTSGKSYHFNGGTGNDTFVGDSASDTAYGGDDTDHLWGAGGDDQLYGENGSDTLVGSAGRDLLSGGSGTDTLDGGIGRDVLSGGTDAYDQDRFVFKLGDSFSTHTTADVISDWYSPYDNIDMPIAGTMLNYGEAATAATTIDAAVYQAANSDLHNKTYAYLYNSVSNTGYMLADLDKNHSFETGVIITSYNGANDMDYLDII